MPNKKLVKTVTVKPATHNFTIALDFLNDFSKKFSYKKPATIHMPALTIDDNISPTPKTALNNRTVLSSNMEENNVNKPTTNKP